MFTFSLKSFLCACIQSHTKKLSFETSAENGVYTRHNPTAISNCHVSFSHSRKIGYCDMSGNRRVIWR